ncbi:MAG: cation:proton antiporter [Aristaeellaceae bacterium]
MLDTLRFVLCCILTAGGLFVLISGVLGLFRFGNSLSRIHAAALFDTLGILLMLSGVMIATGWTIATAKMLLVIAILWLTSPVSSHLIGRMEITINDALEQDMTVIDRQTIQQEKEGD